MFSPGTTPSTNEPDYPPMKQMVERFHAVYSDLVTAYPAAASDTLGAENSYPPTRDSFPTTGDFVAYLMNGHLAYHLGQLSGWRAATGVKSK